MSIFSLIVIAFAVSIDGFWGGFAFGLRKIKIPFLSLVIICSWSVLCTMISMIVGHNIKSFIPMEWAKYIGAALLFFLGLYTLKDGYDQKKEGKLDKKNEVVNRLNLKDIFKVLRNPWIADVDKQNDIKPSEGTILGLAVAMDASIAAFTVSLLGFNPYITPFLFGLTHFILIGAGNIIAKYNFINRLAERFCLLPGFILIGLALLRLV